MSQKVKFPKDVCVALDNLRQVMYPQQILTSCAKGFTDSRYKVLNDVGLVELATALLVGYESSE